MEIKLLLGFIAALLAFGSAYLYIADMFRGNTRPHTYTWLIWTIVTFIAFFGQWVSGGGAGSWATGVTAVYCLFVLATSFKWGTTDITNFDKLCLALSLLSIIPWALTNNILLSVVLASFTDVIGFLPTMRKTWHAPKSESLGSMYIDALKHGLSIAALNSYSVVTWLYPASILVAKFAIIGEIVYRRRAVRG